MGAKIIDLGTWSRYTPAWPEDDSRHDAIHTFAWFRSEERGDWYEFLRSPEAPEGAAAVLDEDGVVVFVGADLTQVVPSAGSRVIVVPGEADYRTLMGKQLSDDGVLVSPPPAVPRQVSAAQAKMALFNVGLLDDLEAIVKDHPYRPVRIWYESANYWERKSPYVAALGPELNLTDEQIDDLFIAAAKL